MGSAGDACLEDVDLLDPPDGVAVEGEFLQGHVYGHGVGVPGWIAGCAQVLVFLVDLDREGELADPARMGETFVDGMAQDAEPRRDRSGPQWKMRVQS